MGRFYRGMSNPRQVKGFRKGKSPSSRETMAELHTILERRLRLYPPDSIMVKVVKEAIAIQKEKEAGW